MQLLNKIYYTPIATYRNYLNSRCGWYILTITQIRSKTPSQWKPVIGLEIHAQMATQSKLFSAASNNFSDPVNTCVALFDTAMPGTLPVLNRKCVEIGVKAAAALSCKINDISMFERKHYFYADMPAGFQITQQKKPLAINGEITFPVFTSSSKEPYIKSSKIKQIQLEQDSGRSLHDSNLRKSLIDLNRAGIPLMEFVFEPDLNTGEEAASLVKELSLILQCLNACSCKMEEGAFRVDANVSVSKLGEPMGVRTEIKNIGSIRAVANAVEYEIKRHISILEKGGEVYNETLAWDSVKKETFLLREKEDKQDYRFMPETNLPPLRLRVDESASDTTRDLIDAVSLNKQLPELPKEIRHRFMDVYKISLEVTTAVMNQPALLRIFEDAIKEDEKCVPRSVANFLANNVLTFLYREDLQPEFCLEHLEYILETMKLLKQKREINAYVVQRLLNKSFILSGRMPRKIVEENNWFIIKDEEILDKLCAQVIEENPKTVRKCIAGKTRALKKLIKEVSARANNCADIELVTDILKRHLR